MKFLLIPCQTSYYSDILKSRSKGAELSTTEAWGIKAWMEGLGNEVDILYNDVGYSKEILSKRYDALILKNPGFIFYGGNISKRDLLFLEFLIERDPDIWVIHNDGSYKFDCGVDSLRNLISKNQGKEGFPGELAERGVNKLESLYKKGVKVLIPGGDLDFNSKKNSSWIPYEKVNAPEINQLVSQISFPNIPELGEPVFDVGYAGVWRKERKKFLERVLGDDRFLSVSNCSGVDTPGKKKEFELEIPNHEETEGFFYLDQQDWYNQCWCQVLVSDPYTYGRFASARWFVALRTNAVPLIQSDWDPDRNLLKEDPSLHYLYVDNSDEVFYALNKVKSPGERERVLNSLRSISCPWF